MCGTRSGDLAAASSGDPSYTGLGDRTGLDSRMKAWLAVAALRNAIARRSPVCTTVHSDRGQAVSVERHRPHN